MTPEEAICAAVDEAEQVGDPLDGLVQKATDDPGAPFEPETREALNQLRKDDPAAWQRLRDKLKKSGVRITDLDRATATGASDHDRKADTQADILLHIAKDADLFHTRDGTSYADITVNGHRETWPIRSTGFRRWISQRYFEGTDGAPSSEALKSALNVIEAQAHFDNPQREVFVRVGAHDGRLYLDLADEDWRAVEIDQVGWRIVKNPPVRFRRPAGMLPLPEPKKGGSIHELRPYLNVRDDDDFVLAVAWLLAALNSTGPYPVLALVGEQGSAKSTVSAILRGLVDPNIAPLRALPREDRDLFIAATNSHVLAFDNVSSLANWISDTICRLATGGGFATRQLYTDQDEVLFDAMRPVILNGIEEVVTRPDLADRAIFLNLQPISEDERRSERELWGDLDHDLPRILGALLDAVAHGLRMLPETRLEKLPRMADFAQWVAACEEPLSLPVSFMAAYTGNLTEAITTVIEADPVASAIRDLMIGRTVRTVWTGTAANLLDALNKEVPQTVRESKSWPKTPRAVSGRLRRCTPVLRKIGFEISHNKEGHTRARMISISLTADNGVAQPSAPSVLSATSKIP